MSSTNKERNARLQKEKRDIQNPNNPVPFVKKFSWPTKKISYMIATIEAPPDSLYAGDIFDIEFTFGDTYPDDPPIVKMLTPIFHPNIDNHGAVCVSVIRTIGFHKSVTIRMIIDDIIYALSHPNPDDFINSAAATMYKQNFEQFKTIVAQTISNNILLRNQKSLG